MPSWRATKDVSIKDDLLEEVGRIVGYDSITPAAPLMPVEPPPVDEERLFFRGVRAMLAAQGFTEVHNYSFISEDQARSIGMDPAGHVEVANPITVDQSLLRLVTAGGVSVDAALAASTNAHDFQLLLQQAGVSMSMT